MASAQAPNARATTYSSQAGFAIWARWLSLLISVSLELSTSSDTSAVSIVSEGVEAAGLMGGGVAAPGARPACWSVSR